MRWKREILLEVDLYNEVLDYNWRCVFLVMAVALVVIIIIVIIVY